jgi:UDP-galactopyranose mutase
MNRSAMAISYDERYMNKDFQYLPRDGFTELFRRMLDHPNITLQLNEDALGHIAFDEANRRVLYDGEPLELLVLVVLLDIP